MMLSISFAQQVAFATNGDNLIGVGPVSRSMAGSGAAVAQDPVGTIFANPAGLGTGAYLEKSRTMFSNTLFDPTVKARVTTPMGVLQGESKQKSFAIPSFAITMPLSESVGLGLGAYGVTGMGVDYQNNQWDLDGNPANGYEGDVYTRLEVMKFAPAVGWRINDRFSVGAALHLDYANLDLGAGGEHDFAYGAQVGAVCRMGMLSLAVGYATPQQTAHERVYNFDAFLGDGLLDTLRLEMPETLIAGLAVTPVDWLTLAVDARHYAWSDASGYSDFDWSDQWVFACGVELRPTDRLSVRAGVNHGDNPVREHNGWDSMGATTVQGTATPTFGYEYVRTIGFPAVVETHATVGLGYRVGETVSIECSYMHGFKETIRETSAGNQFVLETSLEEDSLTLSLSLAF